MNCPNCHGMAVFIKEISVGLWNHYKLYHCNHCGYQFDDCGNRVFIPKQE